jgi:hypothetical protein
MDASINSMMVTWQKLSTFLINKCFPCILFYDTSLGAATGSVAMDVDGFRTDAAASRLYETLGLAGTSTGRP